MRKFHLIGWPGAGKTRVAESLQTAFAEQAQTVEIIEQPGLVWPEIADKADEFLLTVIDSRSQIDDLPALQSLLESGDALILNFWQQADLTTQAWWQSQLRKIVPTKPCILLGMSSFTNNDLQKLLQLSKSSKNPYWKPLQILEFELPTLVLDHLLMVLDSAQRNLGIEIWRAVGVVQSLEYSNLIALEMTRNRLDTFGVEPANLALNLALGATSEKAEKQPQPGLVSLQGYDLNPQQITELLQASLVAGTSLVARQGSNNQVNY